MGLLTASTVKNLNFKNSRWQMAAVLKTVKSPTVHDSCLTHNSQRTVQFSVAIVCYIQPLTSGKTYTYPYRLCHIFADQTMKICHYFIADNKAAFALTLVSQCLEIPKKTTNYIFKNTHFTVE